MDRNGNCLRLLRLYADRPCQRFYPLRKRHVQFHHVGLLLKSPHHPLYWKQKLLPLGMLPVSRNHYEYLRKRGKLLWIGHFS